jgi:hypothetical protein
VINELEGGRRLIWGVFQTLPEGNKSTNVMQFAKLLIEFKQSSWAIYLSYEPQKATWHNTSHITNFCTWQISCVRDGHKQLYTPGPLHALEPIGLFLHVKRCTLAHSLW